MNAKLVTFVTGITLMVSSISFADENKVPYPDDYRNWTHVKSMIIEPGHPLENPFQGIHHVYANDKAKQGLKNGTYNDGSILVFDLISYSKIDNTIQEGKRKLIGVMHKNNKKYAQTGGWGFEGFASDSKNKRLTKDGGHACFACHAPKKNSGYVYSIFRN